MLIGKFPSQEFLAEYELADEYLTLTKACINGDIKLLEQ